MNNFVSAARRLAESIRYSGDIMRHYLDNEQLAADRILESVYQNDLSISTEVTPGLADRLSKVCSRLRLPDESVVAFVYASPDIQAECFSGDSQCCYVRFSSALVDLLDADEFMFVAGHEIGHFLLGHGLARNESSRDSVEFFIQQRAQEISSDRLGLIGCQSLEVAIRAMMKTVSGLNDEHLRFDVGAFLRQLDKTTTPSGNYRSTHPSIFVRCKALLWFSLNSGFSRRSGEFNREELAKLDRRIQIDCDRYVDGPARKVIANAEENLLLWVVANQIVEDGVLDKNEQKLAASVIGKKNLERLKSYLSEISKSDVHDEVYEKLKQAREELERIIPSRFEATYREIEDKVSLTFNGPR